MSSVAAIEAFAKVVLGAVAALLDGEMCSDAVDELRSTSCSSLAHHNSSPTVTSSRVHYPETALPALHLSS